MGKTQISLVGAIAIIVGTVIGASIFILLGPIAASTGPSLFLAYAIAFIPALFGSMFYAQLGAVMPSDGGSYLYCKRLLSVRTGYLVTLSLILGGIGAIVMLAIGFAEYLSYFFPNLPTTAVALSIVVLLVIVNLSGLKTAEVLQIFMTLWILIGLLLFAIPGLFHIEKSHFTPLLPNGWSGLWMGSALAVYSYVGYGIVSEIGGKIKNPKKNLPRAIFISLTLILLMYMLVSFVAIGVVDWQVLSATGASIVEAGAGFLPNSVVVFISIGALFATITTINAIFMTLPGDFMALTDEKIFNQRWMSFRLRKEPIFPILFMGGLAMLGVLTGLSVDYFATITIVGLLLNTVVLGVAVYQLPKKEPFAYQQAAFKIPVPLLKGVVIFGVFFNVIFIVLALLDAPSIAVLFIGWLLIGLFVHHRSIQQVNRNV